MDRHRARIDEISRSPNHFQELVAAEDVAGTAGEGEQKVELASREPLLLAGNEHRPRRGVDGEPVEGQRLPGRHGISLVRPPQNGAHATHQLLGAEGLDHVVVGSQLETSDAVDLGLPGRQHDHGRVGRGAQSSQDLIAVDARKHQVEDDQVGQRPSTLVERLLAVGGRPHGEPRSFEVERNDLRDARFVFNDKDGRRVITPSAVSPRPARSSSFLPPRRVEHADAMPEEQAFS